MKRNLSLLIIIFAYCLVFGIENLHFYPVLDYADETDISGGGVVTYFYRTHAGETKITPSRLYGKFKTGLNKKLDIKGEIEHQLENGKYFFIGSVYFNDHPYTYSGLGNEISENKQEYDSERFNYKFAISRHWDAYSFGFTFTGRHFRNKEELIYEEDEQVEILDGGGWSTGPGLTLEYDTRDNHYFPQKGAYISLNMQNYSIPLGSDYNFDAYKVSISAYQKLIPLYVVAGKVSLNYNDGDLPFHEMSDLNDEIRGFSAGAVKDKYLATSSLELRFFPFAQPFWQRIGFAFFGECGEAGENIEFFRFDELHYSYGIGCRYILNLSELYTVRFDMGFSKEQSSMDFSSSEAF